MKIDITRLPLIPALLTSVVLMALVFMRHMNMPVEAEFIEGGLMPLGRWLDNLLGHGSTLNCAIFLCIIFINAVSVTRIMIRNMIIVARTYLPLLVYVMVGCGIYCHASGTITALAAMLLLSALQHLIKGFQRPPSIDLFFRASLLIGIIPLLWAPGVAYGLIIPIAAWLFRRSIREVVASFVGFILPFAIASYIGWGAGSGFLDLSNELHTVIMTPSGYSLLGLDMGIMRLIVLSLLILLICLSAGTFAAHANNMRTRQRRVYSLHLYLLAISIGLIFVPSFTPVALPLLAVPLSIVLQTFFIKYAGTVSSILYILLIVTIILLNLPIRI